MKVILYMAICANALTSLILFFLKSSFQQGEQSLKMAVRRLMATARTSSKRDTKMAILRPNFLFIKRNPLTMPKAIKVIAEKPMMV